MHEAFQSKLTLLQFAEVRRTNADRIDKLQNQITDNLTGRF